MFEESKPKKVKLSLRSNAFCSPFYALMFREGAEMHPNFLEESRIIISGHIAASEDLFALTWDQAYLLYKKGDLEKFPFHLEKNLSEIEFKLQITNIERNFYKEQLGIVTYPFDVNSNPGLLSRPQNSGDRYEIE